jgi:HAD superfamily hydrolase (TIGR01450 family)
MAAVPWVLDLDGVVWLGDQPLAGAAGAVARLRAAGEPVLFVTNNSFARVADVEAKLAAHGIEAVGDVLTSALAAGALLQRDERVLVVGGPGVVESVERRGCRIVGTGPADVVVVGYNPAFDYALMTAASTAVRDGARLVATNDDATYPTPLGPIPGGGAILASIERATGLAAEVAGKPHPPMADAVRARLGTEGVVVGDRPDTDGRFAQALAYRFGLVLSGVTGAADLPVSPPADLIADDLAALVAEVLGEAPPAG